MIWPTLAWSEPTPSSLYENVSAATRLGDSIAGLAPVNAGAIELDGLNQKDIIVTFAPAEYSGSWSVVPARAVLSDVLGGIPRFSRDHSSDYWDVDAPNEESAGILFADFDNDGHLDFYCPNPTGHQLFHFNPSTGMFEDVTQAMGLNATWIGLPNNHTINGAWGDFDGDGWIDLLVLYGEERELGSSMQVIWRNVQGTGFEDATDAHAVEFTSSEKIVSAHWADFDQDHDLDLLLVQGWSHLQNQTTFWENVGTPGHVLSSADQTLANSVGSTLNNDWALTALGDFNADGWLDLVYDHVTRFGVYVIASDLTVQSWGSEFWGSAEHVHSKDIAAFDADLDGMCDVVCSRYGEGTQGSKLYLSRTSTLPEYGHMYPWQFFSGEITPLPSRGLCAADFTRDGKTEVYLADVIRYLTDMKFFWDISDSYSPDWIGIKPRSSNGLCNSHAIGSTVVVRPALDTWDHVEAKIVDGGSGLASQSDLDLSFGLGSYDGPVDVDVIVPNKTATREGSTICYRNLPSGQYWDLDLDGIVSTTVGCTMVHDLITETVALTITWQTVDNASAVDDQVVFHVEGYAGAIEPAQHIFVGGEDTEFRHGYYRHALEVTGLPCDVNGTFYFSVQSKLGTKVFGSKVYGASPDECPTCEDIPNIDF
nr:CRTAC1 family protein [Candidatus Krumholzibacteria bacterium]